MGERLRRELLRAVAVTYFVCSYQLFVPRPYLSAYSATDGFTDAGTQHINRSNGHALHPAVVTTLARAHINTDDAALARTDVAAVARTDLRDVATDVGADVITHFISNNLADAAADASPGARTDSRPDRTTLEDANHTTLTTPLINTF